MVRIKITYVFKYVLVSFIVNFFLFACSDSTGNANKSSKVNDEKTKTIEQAEQITKEQENYGDTKRQKALLIIAEDRSGSTKDQRKMTENHYRTVFEDFNKKYCGEIDVRLIGNPAPEDRNFFALFLDCPKSFLEVPSNGILTEKARMRRENKEIEQYNKELIRKNQDKINQFINTTVKTKILQYKPYQGRDITDIVDFFEHLKIKLAEPTYKNYDKIMLLIISDGKHDATLLKEPLRLQLDPRVELYLIGWKNRQVFQGTRNIYPFESIDGFVHYFETTK